MRCTPRPASALRYDGSVATSVLPSPVFISATQPRCSAAPPMSCTSKWRWPSTRRPASRTVANASGSRSWRSVGDQLLAVLGVAARGPGPVDLLAEVVGAGAELLVAEPLDLGLERR